MTNKLVFVMGVSNIGIVLNILLYSQREKVDYISIKNPYQTSIKKETKNQKKSEKNEDSNTTLVEVTEECLKYKIVEAFKCNDCFSFILKEQKALHIASHKLEPAIIGIRYKCPKCGKIFIGEYSTFCPRCKGKLKKEIVETDEVKKRMKLIWLIRKIIKKYAQ